MRLTKMVYLASPFTCYYESNTLKHQIERFRYDLITEIGGKLELIYAYAFILPITMSYNTAKYMNVSGEFKYWARRDLTYISRSDEVWVVQMEGWEDSIGIREEVKFAQENNITVRYVHPETLKISKKVHKDDRQTI